MKLNEIGSMSIRRFFTECRLQQRLNHTGSSAYLHGIVAMETSNHYMHLGMVSDFIGDPYKLSVKSLDGLIDGEREARFGSPPGDITKMEWMVLCVDIVARVHEIHQNGIIVGDIKPEIENMYKCTHYKDICSPSS